MGQELKSGTILRGGSYRIEKILGRGGFGITYLATDLSLDRKVAIKEFYPEQFCDRNNDTTNIDLKHENNSEFVGRLMTKFIKEARNIAKFDNPGIIKIHAAFEENNTAYYVMDFIEGESLSEIVKREGPLPEEAALRYITHVGRALDYVHAHSINHLDVKPANIMVRKLDNEPILIDFGLSKEYDADGKEVSATPTGISHGYAPPEQYNSCGVMEFSPQTDLYSLAATFYYILSGVIPPSAPKLVDNKLTFPSSIPACLAGPIARAMSVKRGDRYKTIEEFLDEINADESTIIEPKFKPKPQTYTAPQAVLGQPKSETQPKPEPKSGPIPKAAPAVKPRAASKAVSKSSFKLDKKLLWGIIGGVALVIICVILLTCRNSDADEGYEAEVLEITETGDEYYKAGNYLEAVKCYQEGAELGDPIAQFHLGLCYNGGKGVSQNLSKAVKWYRKAAEQGYAKAQLNLGYCYYQGRGVPKNYSKAVLWYEKAAKQGSADAENNLGYCYEHGSGVKQNYDEAVKWYRKAAAQGNKRAKANLKRMGYSE